MSLVPSAGPPAPLRAAPGDPATKVRWLVQILLFAVTTIIHADRATISIAGADIRRALDLSPVQMGYIFPDFACIRERLGNRLLLGLYPFQHCVNVLTYFFLTWFPVYPVTERHMTILKAGLVASLPAICGFAGGVLGL